ncbi:MAG: thermonuclease family protein [Nanoarchaeota archaeon]|nr:thermonuclease family protein [Nanoarchaeota archaeon]
MKKNSLQTFLLVLICVIALSFLIYLALNLITNQSPANNQTYPEVVEIIDGDTFRTADGEIIRLLCVDTPEKNQKGYDEAVDFLSERLFYSDIRLEGNKTDKYGRSLRWVYVDDILINKEIIDLGFGTLFEYDDEDCSLIRED